MALVCIDNSIPDGTTKTYYFFQKEDLFVISNNGFGLDVELKY